MNNYDKAVPLDFEDEKFALNNQRLFDDFIKHVIKGTSALVALRLVFGDEYIDQKSGDYIFALRRNPYYVKNFDKLLSKIPFSEIWNPKLAVHVLAKIAHDEFAKDAARINAVKELNVISGITVIDETGKTKAGRSMDDFYKSMTETGKENPHYAGENGPKH